MRCVACGRPLNAAPYFTQPSKYGLLAWGPVCGRRVTLKSKPKKEPWFEIRRRRYSDGLTADLFKVGT